ncbi:MAG: DAK2 domain-containing protein [Clostridia bacterium]|nr:DAK2 domain-containing protein [Clostridia bacterium]
MREYLDAATFKEIILCANAALEQNKQLINELNVFPVPDGDTGTNMSLTMSVAATEMQKNNLSSVGEAAERTASALLRGARGNSGVILSLLFRGIAKRLKGNDMADTKLFAAAMSDGVDAAYKAVMKPTEGTILTVSKVATSTALEFAETGSDFERMLACTVESAREALEDTINLNPVLARAGVIDAGGKGYLVILEAMLAVLRGETPVYTTAAPVSPSPEKRDKADFSEFSTGEIAFGYCTEFLIDRDSTKPSDELRAFLEPLGDSIVVVDDDELIKVHVHTNVPGKVLTKALSYGPLIKIKIENMREQHTQLSSETVSAAEPEPVAEPEKEFGIVAICAGAGMINLFKELGADRVVTGGQTMNPSTEDILNEVNRTPAKTVFVFPNNKNIIMAAEQCVPLSEKEIVVIPTKTVPQGVSAILCFDASASKEEMMEAMDEACEATHTALVTYAARDSDFDGHKIHAGEYLALLDGALVGSFANTGKLFEELSWVFDELSPSMITIYYGENVGEAEADNTAEQLRGCFPDAEFSVVDGGQPVYYYMISVE